MNQFRLSPVELSGSQKLFYYAGPSLEEGADAPPGRRVALPLQLYVLKGLCLVQAKLLSMEVAANINTSISVPVAEESLVKVDPYRGSWGMRLLELELWNATDVLFEIVVTRKEADKEGRLVEDPECLYPPTRIDRDYVKNHAYPAHTSFPVFSRRLPLPVLPICIIKEVYSSEGSLNISAGDKTSAVPYCRVSFMAATRCLVVGASARPKNTLQIQNCSILGYAST